MKKNAFTRQFDADFQKIADAVGAVVPKGTRFALFATDEKGDQAAMLANCDRECVLALVGQWVQKNFPERAISEEDMVLAVISVPLFDEPVDKGEAELTKLSTGDDSTLGSYRALAILFFGRESKAVAFLDDKIAKQGADEEVLADEGQMVRLLAEIHVGRS